MRVRRNSALLGVVIVVSAAGGIVSAGTTATGAGATTAHTRDITSASQGGWRHAITALPVPSRGCFTASYPVLAWRSARCAVAPAIPFAPATRVSPSATPGPLTDAVGNGNDYSAVVPGLISKATGAFADVSPGITEKGRDGGVGPSRANTYSLQLNTEFFTTPVCSGSSDPSKCLGWQQFIYDSSADSVFMQYWLIDYGAVCPAAWNAFQGSCYTNSPSATFAGGTVTAPELATTELTGSARAGGTDAVELSNGPEVSVVDNADGVLDLARAWNTTEFGVFGDGGGTQAKFGKKTTLEETTTLVDGTTAAPSCVSEGFTGETNNLRLTNTPALGTVPSPTIGSTLVAGRAPSSSCATAG